MLGYTIRHATPLRRPAFVHGLLSLELLLPRLAMTTALLRQDRLSPTSLNGGFHTKSRLGRCDLCRYRVERRTHTSARSLPDMSFRLFLSPLNFFGMPRPWQDGHDANLRQACHRIRWSTFLRYARRKGATCVSHVKFYQISWGQLMQKSLRTIDLVGGDPLETTDEEPS